MHKLDERGELLVPLVIVTVLLLGSLGFGAWAFMGRQDYKNNTDQKISEAVQAAETALSLKKDAQFAEAEKLPYTSYQGPAAFGTIAVSYPKTWSLYVNETGNSSTPLDTFFHPRFVPADDETNYALRIQVVERSYEQELKAFDSDVKQAKVSVAAYRLPKVESILGSRIDGQIANKKQGVLILLPLRDKTVKIWTEGQDHRADLEEVLKQLTLVP